MAGTSPALARALSSLRRTSRLPDPPPQTPLQMAAVMAMTRLLENQVESVHKRDVVLVAVSTLADFRGRLEVGTTPLDRTREVKKFVQVFVETFFTTRDGRLRNLDGFQRMFGVKRVDVIDQDRFQRQLFQRPTSNQIFTFAVQDRPVTSLGPASFEWIQRMTAAERMAFLKPVSERRFNPNLPSAQSQSALRYASDLLERMASDPRENRQLQIATVIQELRTTRNLAQTLPAVRRLVSLKGTVNQ